MYRISKFQSFTQRFLERLRTTRSKSVDRLRSIAENYDTGRDFKSLTELRQVLLTEQNQRSLVGSDDVSDLLSEVEEELRQVRYDVFGYQFCGFEAVRENSNIAP